MGVQCYCNFLARLNEALNALLITGILIHASCMPYTLLSQGEGGGGLNVTIMMMCITCMMSWLSLVPRDFIVRYQCVGKISRQFVKRFSTHWYLRTKFLRQQHLGKVIYSKGSNQSHQSLCSWLIGLINLLI